MYKKQPGPEKVWRSCHVCIDSLCIYSLPILSLLSPNFSLGSAQSSDVIAFVSFRYDLQLVYGGSENCFKTFIIKCCGQDYSKMPRCALSSCSITSYNTRKNSLVVSFHKFPRDEILRKRWKKFCRLKGSSNLDGFYLCSLHFKNTDFENIYMDGARRKLIKTGKMKMFYPCCY